MAKTRAEPSRLTAHMTVRFRPEVSEWVRLEGLAHPEGQSGVIRDAVEAAYKKNNNGTLRDYLARGIDGD